MDAAGGRQLVATVEQLLQEARRLDLASTEGRFVAAAFPPASRRPGLPWATYLLLRFHPERHDLVDRAAAAGRDQARILTISRRWDANLQQGRAAVFGR
jgi:hypothetical protein